MDDHGNTEKCPYSGIVVSNVWNQLEFGWIFLQRYPTFFSVPEYRHFFVCMFFIKNANEWLWMLFLKQNKIYFSKIFNFFWTYDVKTRILLKKRFSSFSVNIYWSNYYFYTFFLHFLLFSFFYLIFILCIWEYSIIFFSAY